ncbi:putative virion structural protein [Acaryochloris phage A-HIS1]|nr:putative virion structural protein [Acaryochloris phage A-HIS1]
MAIIGLSVIPGDAQNIVGFTAVTPDHGDAIDLLFETVSSTDPSGQVDPPVEPPSGDSTDPLSPDFNYLTLERLTTFPPNTLIINVNTTKLTINGVTYDNVFESGDFAFSLSGAITGAIVITSATSANTTVNGGIPQAASSFVGFPNVSIGDSISWTQSFRGNDLLVTDCFVTEIPKIATTTNGVSSMTIRVGGRLELLRNRNTRVPTLYCGEPPTTAGQAAAIYADVNAFRNTAFPPGNFLREFINGFTSEDAYEFLQQLYNPSNIDIREDPSGNLRAFPRPTFDNTSFAELSHENTIEINTNTSKVTPNSRITVFNRYRRDDGFPTRRETYRTYSQNFDGTPGETPIFNGDPVKVWFLDGSTYTDHIVDYIGESEVFHEEKTYGYIPTATTLFQSDINGVCGDPNIPSQFALITTRTRAVSFVTDSQTELFPIFQTRDFLEGFYTITGEQDRGSGPEATIEIFNGVISNATENFTNTVQPDESVCPQNYISLITASTSTLWGLTETGVYRILSSETNSWATQDQQVPLNPVGNFFGRSQQWIRTTVRGAFNEDQGRWIQEEVPQTTDLPTNTSYIEPITVDITVSGESVLPSLESLYGDREGIPVQGRFCYDIEDCQTYAERILREAAGLHEGRLLVVPYSFPYLPGHSIRFTDKTGEVNDYIVWAVEVNQTRQTATKSVMLMKIFT